MESGHREIELKLELTKNIYKTLLAEFPVQKEVKQNNWFLDTDGLFLLKNLWALRIRFEPNMTLLTAKGPAENGTKIHIRPEYEEQITEQVGKELLRGFQLQDRIFLPCRELIQRFGNLKVQTLFNFQNLRSYCLWDKFTLELDKCTFGKNTWFELEIEMRSGQQKEVQESLAMLFKARGWEIQYSKTNKFIKAFTLWRQSE